MTDRDTATSKIIQITLELLQKNMYELQECLKKINNLNKMTRAKRIRVADSQGRPFSRSPMLSTQLPAWRSRLVLFLIFFAFLLLILRALWLQCFSKTFLQEQGAVRYERTIDLPSTRGKILDRNGGIVASSIPVKAVWAIPDDVRSTPKDKLNKLAQLLDISDEELRVKLDSDRNFVYLKHLIGQETAQRIRNLHIQGVATQSEYKRYYPDGEVMAHIIGFTDIHDVGQDGIELAHQHSLIGKSGSHHVIKDRLGRLVEDVEAITEPKHGKDFVLSIDRNIQYFAFSELKATLEKFKAQAGSAVVLDVHTGEVLALANLPTYNPNDKSARSGSELRNRALTDTFEPGSTFKPFTIALALDTGRVTPQTIVPTSPGKMQIGTATISDSSRHDNLSVTEIIQKSSNIGTAKIALNMPAQEIWEELTKFGFGQKPDIAFPGVAAGRLRPYKSWRPIEQATISYGHGVSVSLLQLAHAYMVFARSGDQIPISFQKVVTPPLGRQVISPTTATQIRDMLEEVVSPSGTAVHAQVSNYRVGGKTGTSYKIQNGKYVKRYISSFVGIAPMSNPRVVVAVMIDEPTVGSHYGGAVAGPLFSKITTQALRNLEALPDGAPISSSKN